MTHPQQELRFNSVSFFGRTFAEYKTFFALEQAQLAGRTVLDVAAGPSSFTAEACDLGIDATAVDPLFGCTPGALTYYVHADYDSMFQKMRENRALFRGRFFASIDEAEVSRRAAADLFLADYAAHFPHGRYRGASLPDLPFPDKSFDLVLCAHLLFIYARRFDFNFHFAACRELLRVSKEEVRIHPVVGPGGKPYPDIERLRMSLKGSGIDSEIAKVDYEFFAGTDTMLTLRRTQ